MTTNLNALEQRLDALRRQVDDLQAELNPIQIELQQARREQDNKPVEIPIKVAKALQALLFPHTNTSLGLGGEAPARGFAAFKRILNDNDPVYVAYNALAKALDKVDS